MKHFSILLFSIFLVLTASFMGMILASLNQIGSLEQSTETLELNDAGEAVQVEGDPLFPQRLSGLAQQGANEYINLGCVQCHSQQIRREAISADIERGLAQRVTVPRDYIMQKKTALGTLRLGPDLIDVGSRRTDSNWHLVHLYNPQITSPGSLMPAFPFLFEQVDVSDSDPPADALVFPDGNSYAPEANYAVVPSRRALAIVEYLLNLRLNYSLPEAALTQNERGE